MLDPERAPERLLELLQARPERQVPGAQHLEHELLLALAKKRPGRGDHERAAGVVPRVRECSLRAGSMPASSESTSASQLASITFSETPIEPHVSTPSDESSSTRVTAPVPLRSSRMRTLKFTSSMSRRCG